MLKKDFYIQELKSGRKLNPGVDFEYAMIIAYSTTRYYPYNPASKSGDIVANGIHFQIKSDRGFWENIENIEQFENHILKICKAKRYLLRISKTEYQWLDVSKEEIIHLAKKGYITFEKHSKGRPIARWSMTKKEAMHLYMRENIKPIENYNLI
jgi:hypothetical protein